MLSLLSISWRISGPPNRPDHDRHDAEPFPQIELAEHIARHAGLRIDADERDQQAERAHDHALEHLPARQRGDEHQAHHGQHEEFGRAECQHHRPHDRNGEAPGTAAPITAPTQRAHQHRAERAPGLALSRHRVTVEHDGRRCRLAGNAEQHRGDVACRRGDHLHAEQKGKHMDRLHAEGEGKHEGHCDRPADPRQNAYDEADEDADQHQPHRARAENLEQAGQALRRA